ncbi:MAG: hypothetical protein RR512_05935 [Coprobacillus sp.]
MEFRILRGHEVKEAVELIQRTFLQDIAPYYDPQGANNFTKTHNEESYLLEMRKNKYLLIGAFEETLVI